MHNRNTQVLTRKTCKKNGLSPDVVEEILKTTELSLNFQIFESINVTIEKYSNEFLSLLKNERMFKKVCPVMKHR